MRAIEIIPGNRRSFRYQLLRFFRIPNLKLFSEDFERTIPKRRLIYPARQHLLFFLQTFGNYLNQRSGMVSN